MNRGIRCPSTPRFGMRRVAVLIIAVISAIASHSASAAKVYQCGNVFQDQPCPEAKPGDSKPAEAKTARRVERIQVAERTPEREAPRPAGPQPRR